MAEVAAHEKQLHDIQNQLEQYAENDPDKINSMSRLLLSQLHIPLHTAIVLIHACYLRHTRHVNMQSRRALCGISCFASTHLTGSLLKHCKPSQLGCLEPELRS